MQNNYILIVKYPSIKPMIKLWRLFHKRTTYNVQFIQLLSVYIVFHSSVSGFPNKLLAVLPCN
jgi:hypothetical protein